MYSMSDHGSQGSTPPPFFRSEKAHSTSLATAPFPLASIFFCQSFGAEQAAGFSKEGLINSAALHCMLPAKYQSADRIH